MSLMFHEFSNEMEILNPTNTLKVQLSATELIHVIKTGFKDKLMVVYEDVFEQSLGKVEFYTHKQFADKFGIEFEGSFVKITDQTLPPLDKLLWLYDKEKNYVFLGVRSALENQGWFWAELDGDVWIENGEIVAECQIEDLEPTHYCFAPCLPNS